MQQHVNTDEQRFVLDAKKQQVTAVLVVRILGGHHSIRCPLEGRSRNLESSFLITANHDSELQRQCKCESIASMAAQAASYCNVDSLQPLSMVKCTQQPAAPADDSWNGLVTTPRTTEAGRRTCCSLRHGRRFCLSLTLDIFSASIGGRCDQTCHD